MNSTRRQAPGQREGTFVADDLTQLLGRPIAYHRIFAHLTSDPGAALFLSQALYWTPRASHTNRDVPAEDGWFYKTQAEWWLETGLSRRNQETARRRLKTLGILQEQRRGQKGHIFYKIDLQRLAQLLRALIDNKSEQFEMAESASSKSANRAAPSGAFAQLPLSTETTAETTAPRRAKSRDQAAPVAALDDGDEVRLWLRSIGVGQARAGRLARDHADELQRRRKYLPFLENVRDAARLVTARLGEEWDEPQAVRDQAAAEERAQGRRVAARQATARRAEERQAQASAQDDTAALDEQLAKMPAKERADIERQAQTQLRTFAASGAPFAPPIDVLRRNILRTRLGS